MIYTLQHELSHLFGAVDIVQKGSVMGTDHTCNEFDKFTSQIIFYNKYRTFNPYIFPLPEDKLDEALSIYDQRKKLNRREVNINIILASIFLEKEDYDSVIEECREVIEINPDLPEIYNFLGIAYRRKGEIGRAIKEYKKVILLWPQFPEIHYNLGIALMKKGMIDEAVKEYQKDIEINPNYAYCKMRYCRFQLNKENTIKNNSEDTSIFHFQGSCY